MRPVILDPAIRSRDRIATDHTHMCTYHTYNSKAYAGLQIQIRNEMSEKGEVEIGRNPHGWEIQNSSREMAFMQMNRQG